VQQAAIELEAVLSYYVLDARAKGGLTSSLIMDYPVWKFSASLLFEIRIEISSD
jgi:hypothetical protein